MSDYTVPSYRVRPERTGFQIPWRMVALAGAALGAAAVGGGIVWGISRAVNHTVPVIEADTRPIRVKPSDPGGMRVANQDERIFESQRRGATGVAAQPRLSPEPERPDVAALRQAAARQPVVPATLPPVAADLAPVRPPLVNPSLGPQGAGTAPVAPPAGTTQAAPAAVAATASPPAVSAQPVLTQPVLAPPAPAQTAPAQPASPQTAPQPAAMQAPAQPPVPQAAAAAQATSAITPPPMPANSPVPRSGRVVVQLGALGSEEAARNEWSKLQGRLPALAGREPQITRVDRGDLPPLWRIRTTNMPDLPAARALCESAKAKSLPCAVLGG